MWALAAVLAGCARAPSSEPEPPLAARPTVVSLNPCTDAILVQLADPAQVLAISHYSHDPRASSMPVAQAARFTATRGSVEDVLALQPDVVLGSSFTDPATASAFARLGLPLERFGVAGTVAESRAQIRQIAALVGHPRRGEALIARIDRALAQAAPPPGAGPVSAVVWQADGLVPGEQTLIVDLLQRTGFANHAAHQGLGQADRLSLEQLLTKPPRVLLTINEGPDRMRSHPALASLASTQRHRLDPRLLYCGGPTIIAAVERLAQVRRRLGARQPGA
nr:ABC transporter substrate-binding protein [Alteraurantiacibacter buctensis]